MKSSVLRKSIFLLPLVLLFVGISAAQDSQFPALAKQIVTTSVSVKPGDVVVVYGGQNTIPLMEDIAIEAAKAGAMVQLLLNTDRLARTFNADVPEQYLKQQPKYFADWLKEVDVWIALPDVEDQAAAVAGVSAQRLAEMNQAGEVIAAALNSSKLRFLFVNFPTKSDAALYNVPYPDLEKMHWDAVSADYRQISDKGHSLAQMLEHARAVRITSAKGTDLTFSLAGRSAFVDAGIVTEQKSQAKFFGNRAVALPGGTISFAPLETSGTGKVFAIRERCRPDVQLVGASFDVQNGKIANFKAESGADCYHESIATYTGPKDVLGSVSIGLNPALKVSSDYRPDAAAGMIWLTFGNNELLGGNNLQPGNFTFPITNATVEIDGKTVIKDGQLLF
jgi:aminopeptidase